MNIFRTLLVASLVFASYTASAAPIACTWSITAATTSGNVSFNCNNPTYGTVATRVMTHSAPYTSNPSCTLSISLAGVNSEGTCLNPSFNDNTCASGTHIANLCAQAYSSSGFQQNAIPAVCGTGCSARYDVVGYTPQCPAPSRYHQVDSPELAVYCE